MNIVLLLTVTAELKNWSRIIQQSTIFHAIDEFVVLVAVVVVVGQIPVTIGPHSDSEELRLYTMKFHEFLIIEQIH